MQNAHVIAILKVEIETFEAMQRKLLEMKPKTNAEAFRRMCKLDVLESKIEVRKDAIYAYTHDIIDDMNMLECYIE